MCFFTGIENSSGFTDFWNIPLVHIDAILIFQRINPKGRISLEADVVFTSQPPPPPYNNV
jgi:hypothetical protein